MCTLHFLEILITLDMQVEYFGLFFYNCYFLHLRFINCNYRVLTHVCMCVCACVCVFNKITQKLLYLECGVYISALEPL